jgi:hypothetical protein
MAKRKPKKEMKLCLKCNTSQSVDKFYLTRSALHADGRIPFCKKCLKEMTTNATPDELKALLKQIDKPYVASVWVKAISNKGDTFGNYMRMINSLPQYKNMNGKDVLDDISPERLVATTSQPEPEVETPQLKPSKFKVTREMVERWGEYEDQNDYRQLEQFFHSMMDANRIETPQDINYLKKLAVISLKMDKELASGNYDQVKKLGDLFSKYMADSKFRAMDQTDATKTGGLRTFGQVYAEIEKDGFIPPWEDYSAPKGLTQDIVDKTIMYILNYTLKLNQISVLTKPPEGTPEVDDEDAEV